MSFHTPLHRLTLPKPSLPTSQTRHATLIRRPLRPYTFTQLVTLSDGSTFLHRTTSPQPMYRCNKDTRNTPLWNPSSQKLMNMEADEAGRLRAFREKFGRGWDAERMDEDDAEEGEEGAEGREKEDNLVDLISAFGRDVEEGKNEGKKKDFKGKKEDR